MYESLLVLCGKGIKMDVSSKTKGTEASMNLFVSGLGVVTETHISTSWRYPCGLQLKLHIAPILCRLYLALYLTVRTSPRSVFHNASNERVFRWTNFVPFSQNLSIGDVL